MLRAVYAKLNIKLEFRGRPRQAGAGAVERRRGRRRNPADRNAVSRLPDADPGDAAINYIEPAVFTAKLHFDVDGWEFDQETTASA